MKRFNILYNKYLIICIGLLFTNLLFNCCYSLKEVNIENNESTTKVYKIETLDDKVIDFRDSKLGYALLSNNELVSHKPDGEEEVFPMSNVKKYYTEEYDSGKTVLLIAGCTLALGLIVVALVSIKLKHLGSGIDIHLQ